ncbi:hypothetical protein SeGA_5117 [Salmonella enterica subsp. enterica serovar Gaminara str. A4-567]|nr:hypothetical protein SeGA_5117 [Salmonella enterica subsp. enterica serovar Gaminara str. A4-567]
MCAFGNVLPGLTPAFGNVLPGLTPGLTPGFFMPCVRQTGHPASGVNEDRR